MRENQLLNQQIFEALEKRIGRDHLGKRLRLQVKHTVVRFNGTRLKIHWENAEPVYVIMKFILKFSGLLNRGMLNALDYRVQENAVHFKNLPRSFKDFRILQLSDIHLEGITDNGERLLEKIREIDFDLCVITGDFRFFTFGDYEKALTHMGEVVDSLQSKHGILGILGNHDFIEMVPGIEAMGIKILLNEAVPIRRGDEVIWIAGVDDPHFYEVHNLKRALQKIPQRDFKVLLAHSPELIEDASRFMIDYYLCGHTHGGQICLPGGIPIITNTACSRKYVSGEWTYQEMAGHTSRGTGSSGLSVRFFCPPEITLHRLL